LFSKNRLVMRVNLGKCLDSSLHPSLGISDGGDFGGQF